MGLFHFIWKFKTRLFGRPSIKTMIKGGMRVGKNCYFDHNVLIDPSHYWLISIGDNVKFGEEVCILAHDGFTYSKLGYTRIGKIEIEDNVEIGTRAIILPGVKIGKNAMVAAGSVVTKNVPPGILVAGNPARKICTAEEYLSNKKNEMKNNPIFGIEYTLRGGVGLQKRIEMNERMKDGIGYVE